jgi:hypothetical protein
VIVLDNNSGETVFIEGIHMVSTTEPTDAIYGSWTLPEPGEAANFTLEFRPSQSPFSFNPGYAFEDGEQINVQVFNRTSSPQDVRLAAFYRGPYISV